MSLDLWSKTDIRNSLLAGITLAATNPDPVLVAGMLIAFKHQAHCFGINWPNLLQEAASTLPQPAGDWLLSVSRGEVLSLTKA